MKDVEFNFYNECLEAFLNLKNALIPDPIMQRLDWGAPFEIMCDANDYIVGTTLGQKRTIKCMSFIMLVGHWMRRK